jgi:alanyl-tRNA synthetase
MLSSKIRKEFLHYFKNNHHKIVASSSVIPHDDPTLLFINAGMNQFKDVFLGQSYRDYKRATTAQKCIRVGGKHNDLDNVGHTSRHMTFFEMLGNFSFGDYFKKEAIDFAWEMTLNVFGFDGEKIWASVFEEDDEAFELWKKHLPEKRIIRLGKKDNFWMMGETGPCGPCSELLYDRGEKFGSARSPKEDSSGERYLEFWNLVFMQYNAMADGKMTHLPNKSVDTGAGLERVVSLIEDVDSVFKIDIFRELIAQIEDVLSVKYNPNEALLAPAFHVISDHLRSLSFAIADGAQPSNIERGYVLRKLLRRAVRYGRMLGAEKPFLAKVFPRLLQVMGNDYHELKSAQDRICEILTLEEEGFFKTLKKGGNILSSIIQKTQSSQSKEITGEDAFKLKDTYGFPLEEILLIAKDYHLGVNLDSYQVLEVEAKERSKKAKETHIQQVASSTYNDLLEKYGSTQFVGYKEKESESTLLAILQGSSEAQKLEEGESAFLILEKTPFYPEKGGQIFDTGTIFHDGAEFIVEETIAALPDLTLHRGHLKKGCLIPGEPVRAKIDLDRRNELESNHSATHLLHFALHQVLGDHIRQAGSLVERDKLRFDFNHHKPITQEELREVEKIENSKIRSNSLVEWYEMSYEQAQKSSEIKQFFGEKYGLTVRVVDMVDCCKELCGGTHVSSLGKIGLFKILKESSIAKGVRRIEAATGAKAEEHLYELEDKLATLEKTLESPSHTLLQKAESLVHEIDQLKTLTKKYRAKELQHMMDELKGKTSHHKEIEYLCAKVDLSAHELHSFANALSSYLPNTTFLLAIESDNKCQIILKVAAQASSKGMNATDAIKPLATLIQGSGGGKGATAQAGGVDATGILKAFDAFKKSIEALC